MLSTTILVGNPFAGFTQVVEVEHGRNRIDTQTIDMIFSEPEQGIGYEKIAHFTATIIKDIGTPFLVFPFACIGIYIQRSEEHTSELQSLTNLVCRLLLEKKKMQIRCDVTL